MAFSKKKTLTLILTLVFLLSTLTALTAGQRSGDIHAILGSYGLPPGLFPDVATNATVGPNSELTVDLSYNCYIPFPYRGFRYLSTVTGLISAGKIENIVGVGVQIQMPPWIPVRVIRMVTNQWPYGVLFDTGSSDSSMTLSADIFNEIPRCYNQHSGITL